MQPLIGTPKQILWAEKIREQMTSNFVSYMEVLHRKKKIEPEFFSWAEIIFENMLNNTDAGDWIRFKDQHYSIAARVGLLGQLRERLGWSYEEEKAIGYGAFDRLKEIAV